jgi:hypothetical protein
LPDYPALPGSWFGKKGCGKDIRIILPDKLLKKILTKYSITYRLLQVHK